MQSRNLKIAFLSALVAASLVALIYRFELLTPKYGAEEARAAFAGRLKAISGPKATNCGTEKPDLNCVSAALDRKAPFWFVAPLQGIEGVMVLGFASDANGLVWQMAYDELHEMPKAQIAELSPVQCTKPAVSNGWVSCHGL